MLLDGWYINEGCETLPEFPFYVHGRYLAVHLKYVPSKILLGDPLYVTYHVNLLWGYHVFPYNY